MFRVDGVSTWDSSSFETFDLEGDGMSTAGKGVILRKNSQWSDVS